MESKLLSARRQLLPFYFGLVAFIFSHSGAFASFRIVGYFPTWQGNVNTIQYDRLTHINYSFLFPTSTGDLPDFGNPSRLTSLVTLAHEKNVKVLVAIGGWNNGIDANFEAFAANAEYRTHFVSECLEVVEQYNLDGVDMDWEYPDPGQSAQNFYLLMKELSDSLKPKGKLLTAAVVASGNTVNGVLTDVFPYVDFLNIMAYDNSAETNHSTYNFAINAITTWVNRGLPRDKAILGVPFYARPTYLSYNTLVNTTADNAYRDTHNGSFYNGMFSIEDKTNYALVYGGGVMIWEISQDSPNDTYSLLKVIYDTVILSGTPLSSEPARDDERIKPKVWVYQKELYLSGITESVEVDVYSLEGRLLYRGLILFPEMPNSLPESLNNEPALIVVNRKIHKFFNNSIVFNQ